MNTLYLAFNNFTFPKWLLQRSVFPYTGRNNVFLSKYYAFFLFAIPNKVCFNIKEYVKSKMKTINTDRVCAILLIGNVLSAPIFFECRSAPAPCQKKECHSHFAPFN